MVADRHETDSDWPACRAAGVVLPALGHLGLIPLLLASAVREGDPGVAFDVSANMPEAGKRDMGAANQKTLLGGIGQ
jgi:hypothetical protein